MPFNPPSEFKGDYVVNACIIPQSWQTPAKVVIGVMILLLFAVVPNASALTAQTVMENVLKVYEDVADYEAVVFTYRANSMEVSESELRAQTPLATFNLFFRKPNEHAVKEINKSRYGVFRLELLSTLGIIKNYDLVLKGREYLGENQCYVLEVSSLERPGEHGRLWISPKNWQVMQLTISMVSVDTMITRFTYPVGGRYQHLPIETRSFFPLSKRVLINRITDYKINTGLPSAIFKKKTARVQPE